MRHALVTAIVLAFTISPHLLARPDAAEQPASMQELKQLFESKQWQPLLQKLSKALPLRGAAAQQYDRYELLTMKGEAHLNLKQGPAAVSAFEEASKIKDLDRQKLAVADATVLLVKRSPGMTYKRKSPGAQPSGGDDDNKIDITDRDKRKEAFAALAADEQAALQPKAKAAAAGKSLRPIAEMLKSLDDLRNAEMAASGTSETPLAAALVAPLAKHAKELTDKELLNQKATVDKIERSANQIEEAGGVGRSRGSNVRVGPDGRILGPAPGQPGNPRDPIIVEKRYKKRGLQGMDMQTLKGVIETCQNIERANKQLAEVFTSEHGQPLLDTARDADDLARRAKTLLETDFSPTTSDPNTLK
jgi:hypothetical protein